MRKIQLFGIPYAGGLASMFDDLKGLLREDIAFYPLEYAGRGTRSGEKPYASFKEMAEDMAAQILSRRDPSAEYGIFGYSMGSVVAYEILANNLLDKAPKAFILASHEPPNLAWESKQYAALSDDLFFDKLVEMGGFDESHRKLLGNKFFRRLYFEPLRIDYQLIGEYKMTKAVLLDTVGLVLYSSADISERRMKDWSKFFKSVRFVQLGSNHFFIKDCTQAVADEINRIIL